MHRSTHRTLGRVLVAVAVLAALSLLAASCGDDPDTSNGNDDTTTSEDPMTDPLDGSTFTSTSVTGHELVDGSAVRLMFEDGQLGLSAGCNQMGGGYSLDGDRLVIDGAMRSTEMACDPPLMDQDSWLASWVGEGLTWRLDGAVLTLSGADVVMELTAETTDEGGTVEGSWELDTILSGEVASSVPADVETPTLDITADQMSVFTGCNRGGATVEVSEGSITFGPLRLTRMACPEPAMQLEATVTAVLDGTVPYTVTAELLTIGDESSGLVWRRASSD